MFRTPQPLPAKKKVTLNETIFNDSQKPVRLLPLNVGKMKFATEFAENKKTRNHKIPNLFL